METVAWKVPIELVIDGGVENSYVSRLEEPPIDTAFLKKGDELWDISKALVVFIKMRIDRIEVGEDPFDPFSGSDEEAKYLERELKFDGAFAVWNATSKMIVVSGTAQQIQFVHSAVDLRGKPKTVMANFDYYEGDELKQIALISRSGETASGQVGSLKAEIAPCLSIDSSLIDISLAVTFQHDGSEIVVNTAATALKGEHQQLAKWWNGNSICKLGMKVDVVTSWGVPLDDVVNFEPGKRDEDTAIPDIHNFDGTKVGENLVIKTYHVPPDFMQRISGEDEIPCKVLEVPEGLGATKFALGACIDARPALKANGVSFESPLALAGFDPNKLIIILINTAANHDLMELIVPHDCGQPMMMNLSLQHDTRIYSLTCRSGEIASIEVKQGEKEACLFEVAANPSSSGTIIDVAYKFNPVDSDVSYESAVTLIKDWPTKIGEYNADGEKYEIRLTGEIIGWDEEHGH